MTNTRAILVSPVMLAPLFLRSRLPDSRHFRQRCITAAASILLLFLIFSAFTDFSIQEECNNDDYKSKCSIAQQTAHTFFVVIHWPWRWRWCRHWRWSWRWCWSSCICFVCIPRRRSGSCRRGRFWHGSWYRCRRWQGRRILLLGEYLDVLVRRQPPLLASSELNTKYI